MPAVEFHPRFHKVLSRKSASDRRRIEHTVERIALGKITPGMRVKKMTTDEPVDVWEASPSMALRITFNYLPGGGLFFRNNCNHEVVERRSEF